MFNSLDRKVNRHHQLSPLCVWKTDLQSVVIFLASIHTFFTRRSLLDHLCLVMICYMIPPQSSVISSPCPKLVFTMHLTFLFCVRLDLVLASSCDCHCPDLINHLGLLMCQVIPPVLALSCLPPILSIGFSLTSSAPPFPQQLHQIESSESSVQFVLTSLIKISHMPIM